MKNIPILKNALTLCAALFLTSALAGQIGSVRSTGTQYLKTGFTPDGTTEISVYYKLTAMPTAENKGYVFGEWGSNLGRLQFSHNPSSDGTSYVGFFGYGKTYSNLMPFTADTQWHTIEYRTGKGFYHDGSLVTIAAEYIPSGSDEQDFTKWGGTPAELYLYACDGNGGPQDGTLSKADIASCKITKGDTVVRDLVAWQKEDGTVCFKNLAYDGSAEKGDEYYASAADDAFVAGDEINDFTQTTIALAEPAVWTGKAVVPTLTVTSGETTLVQDKDYTVSCTDSRIGPATATVTGNGSWKGEQTFDFEIVCNPNGLKVTLDRVAQRYPWNGLVDIDYTVSGLTAGGHNPLDVVISFAFSSASADKNIVCPTKGTAADGTYRLTWDLKEVGAFASDAQISAKIDILGMPTAADAEFMVVDLSNGYNQPHAITYVRGTSAGSESERFNTDEYKTSKLVLRKVHAAGKTFRMGIGTGSGNKLGNVTNDDPTEGNWHEVGFTKDYFLGIFEFTYGQFKTIMGGDKWGENQMTYSGNMAKEDPVDICAAYRLSYNQLNSSIDINLGGKSTAMSGGVIGWLNSHLDTESSALFALPTEAQWEYAARNGTRTTHSWGNYYEGDWVGFPQPYVWWQYTCQAERWGGGSGTCGHGVGRKNHDSWGFYDLIGNWAELVNDWYDSTGYESGVEYVVGGVTWDPTGPADDTGFTTKVARGGYFQPGVLYSAGDRNCGLNMLVSDFSNYLGSRLKANVEAGGTTGETETIWTTTAAFSLDESFSAYGVLTPSTAAEILPIVWNSDTNWPAGGDAEATATLTLSEMSGTREADPSTWTVGATRAFASGAGEGTAVWVPTENRLYRFQQTVGENVITAYFDLTDTEGISSVNVTIQCPANVEVADVSQSGSSIPAKADGTYDVAASQTMTVTYRTTNGKLFADGTTEHVVENITPAKTLPPSTCDIEVVPAVAQIGETKYVSLQAAFDVGGEVVLLDNHALTSSVTLDAGETVKLDLGGKTLTADGISAFVNAGTLEIGNGGVTAGTLVANTGSFRVKTGVYSEDVSVWCAPGFHVEAQATQPPTWLVVMNATCTLSLDLSALSAHHVAAVELTCDGTFTCTTNDEGVVVWSLPSSLPYTLTYTAEHSYFFDSSSTVSVVNETGLSADTVITPDELPTPVQHIVWVWDEKAKTLTDGDWTFHEVTKSGSGLVIASSTYEHKYTAVSNVDFTTCADTAGWPLVSVTASLSAMPLRTFIAPDLVSLSTFYESKVIEEVVVSPNIYHVNDACFYNCTNLRKFSPTVLPKLEFHKKIFGNCYKLEGDFELDAWQEVTQDEPFSHCEKVTSLKLPNLTRCNKNIEFGYMYSLTNFYAPKLVYMNSSTLGYCSKLKTVVISDSISYMGYGIFGGCKSLVSLYPTTFTNLTSLGGGAFTDVPLAGDINLPLVQSLGANVFGGCTALTGVYAPNAGLASNPKYMFNNCSSITSIVIKGGADLGECNAFANINPKATIYWLGTNVPTRIGSWGLCAAGGKRATLCIKDEATRQAWVEMYATRVKDTKKFTEKSGFTADDRADETYPGRRAVAVALPGGGNAFWIARPQRYGLTVIIR